MTAIQAGAPSTYAKNWNQVNWKKVRAIVYRMQTRIAKSIREGRWGKAKVLLQILARSFCGKLLAVKRITSNKGSRTQLKRKWVLFTTTSTYLYPQKEWQETAIRYSHTQR